MLAALFVCARTSGTLLLREAIMSRLVWVLCATLVFVQGLVGQAKMPKAAADPESAIPAVLLAQVDAWNRGDLQGFMEGYWKSPDLVFASGTQETRGWEPVLQHYQQRYQSGGAEMGNLSFSFTNGVHVMSPEFAYIDGEFHLTMSKGKETHGVFTLIFRKFPEGWRIVHDRTCAD
jgi:ketosteroid isomerase-like protein